MDYAESSGASDHPTRTPPTWQQPLFVVPATVAVDLLVIQTDQVAVTIGPLRCYPSGFEFTLDAHMHHAFDMRRYTGSGGGARPSTPGRGPRALLVDLVYADGRRGGSAGPWPESGDDVAPGTLVVLGGGAVGSQYTWHSWCWVHPLPPPGPVVFHVAWPAYDIAETRVEIEGGLIREAATRAITLWADQEGEPRSAHTPEQ